MGLTIEAALRQAGRERRKVRVTGRYLGEAGEEKFYERDWEPYEIDGDEVVVYSYFRDEFRRAKLDDIVKVEIMEDTFTPRRPIDL